MIFSSLLLPLLLHTGQSGIVTSGATIQDGPGASEVPAVAQEIPVPEAQQKSSAVTIYGVRCLSGCHKGGIFTSYYYCDTLGSRNSRNSGSSQWDYCSPSSKVTRYGEKCKDACRSSTYGYSWCNTESSWDYCSSGSSGGGRSIYDSSQVPRVGNSLYWLFVLPCVILLCIGGCKVYTDTALCKDCKK